MAAVSTYDLTAADIVERRLPQKVLHASSNPTVTQAGNVLTQIAAKVNGALRAVGITPSDITSATATATDYQNVRLIIEDGFCANLIAAERHGFDERSQPFLDSYNRTLKLLRDRPEEVIPDSFSASSTATQPRSHITDNSMTDSGTVNTDATPPFRYTDKF